MEKRLETLITMPYPKSKDQAGFSKAVALSAMAHSLEEFIYLFCSNRYSLRFLAFPEGGTRRFNAQISKAEAKIPLGMSVFPDAFVRKYKFKPLTETVQKFADSDQVCEDQQWFEERNKRLHLRYDQDAEVFLAPPASVAELILSYAFATIGTVEAKREMIELRGYIPTDCIRLTLTFASPNTEVMWHETLYVELDKLAKLIKKRSVKVRDATLRCDPANAH